MHPVVFHFPDWIPILGGAPLRYFGLFIVDAFFFATLWAQWRYASSRQESFAERTRGFNVMAQAVLGSVVSRIFWVFVPGPGWKFRLGGVLVVDLLLLLRARVRFGKLLDEKSREEAEFVFSIAFWLLVTGFIGARLFWIVTTPSGRADFVEQPLHAVFAVWDGGIVYYGGLLLAVFFGAWYLWVKGKNIMEFGDILICGVALTLYVGRWACFSAGCDHGVETGAPWGLIYEPKPGGVDPVSLIPEVVQGRVHLHPTQLYMSLNGLLIFFITAFFLARKRFHGQIVYLFMVLYPVGRSIIESYRGDTGRGIYGVGSDLSLSSSQIISIPVFLIALLLLVRGHLRARGKPLEPEPAPPA